jgi:uncharacterized membrane protein YjgN (DUF898 family)
MVEAVEAAASARDEREVRQHAFEFSGTGGEFFRIWIVNIFLTLATLGIYSAWANVRTLGYFAASTSLDGASFAYLANPYSILKGRLLVLSFGALYAIVSVVAPSLEGLLAIAVLLLVPWVIVRSLAFRAHNHAWRNIRFRFDAPYGDAFVAFVGLPFLALLTLGLLYPQAVFRQRRLIVDHASFGTTGFRGAASGRDFYRAFATLIFMLIGIVIAIGAIFSTSGEAGVLAISIAAVPFYFYLFAYMSSQITNLTYEGMRIGEHRLSSRLPAAELAFVYGTNALAMLASLGLLIPWARVRMTRFRLRHMSLYASGSLEEFAAAEAEEVASLGAELGEALDLELGL